MYLPDTFRRFFRMSRSTFEVLCSQIAPELETRQYPGGRPEMSVKTKALITLRFLASQETIVELSDRFDLAEDSITTARCQVVNVYIQVEF
jgi:hypothetical protein